MQLEFIYVMSCKGNATPKTPSTSSDPWWCDVHIRKEK